MGKFNFDHHFAFLTNFLKRYNFLLGGIFSARREDHFQKNCPKRIFPSDFVKLGSEILHLFLVEKMDVSCLLCCNFVRFWHTFFLNPF